MPDDQNISPLLSVQDKDELAALLGTTKRRLNYLAYVLDQNNKYSVFEIKKRDGGVREIKAPVRALKAIQRRLAVHLRGIYEPKICAHGYIQDRSILSNASIHKKQKWVFKIDLKSFFPSINFGRVRGLFLSHPFNLPTDVATILAQICTDDGSIPQGSPTSPVISNLICQKLDRQLNDLSSSNRCYYSRYADDIVFSTSASEFPNCIGFIQQLADGTFAHQVGKKLESIITNNGFEINNEKTSLRGKSSRQIVTGIVVNEKINLKREYVREVRSILHSWRVNGKDAAAIYYYSKIDKKNRINTPEEINFASIVRGKVEYIGQVKGWSNPTYCTLAKKLAKLDKGFKNKKTILNKNPSATVNVYTEGKTDIKHLMAALAFFKESWQFTDLDISYADFGFNSHCGDDALVTKCKSLASHNQSLPTIVISDRDTPVTIAKLSDGGLYKNWGNNVYSFAIPVPAHREGNEKVCIEMYYYDDVIGKKDADGRRLYFTSEFNPKTGKHSSEQCYCPKLSTKKLIIDTEIFELTGNDDKNLCLSKNRFADFILQKHEPFTNIDFSAFIEIFNIIQEILEANVPSLPTTNDN